MKASDICVVIVHFGAPSPTLRVLADIGRQTAAPGMVLVIDNGGFGEPESERLYSVLRPGRNLGYAGAINAGAKVATSAGLEALWVLNNDVELVPVALSSLAKALDSTPDADVIGSYITTRGCLWFGGGSFSMRTGLARHEHYGKRPAAVGSELSELERTGWVNGCSMLIPLRSIQRRGPFDEFLFLYREEFEWQLRNPLARAYVVTLPLVEHKVGLTTGSTEGRLGRTFMARNAWLLAGRQHGAARFGWYLGWTFEFVLIPLRHRNWKAIQHAFHGVRMRGCTGQEVLQAL